MRESYWLKLSQSRIARRRALGLAGSTMLGTALVAACGGEGDADPDGGASGLVINPTDTSKVAKRGGISKWFANREPNSFDPAFSNINLEYLKDFCYTLLVRHQPGYLKTSDLDIASDLAESWEWSPDGLQLTLKLRQGVKWHNKPPVNGRTFDMEDVLFSWKRTSEKGSQRAAFLNSINPEAPIVSLTATDAKTIVIKLKEPVVYLLAILARDISGHMNIVPKEADTSFDIRYDMIGTGPFMLHNYTPSVIFTFKRNPDFYFKEHLYVDQVDAHILLEYASALAQFKAGNIFTYDVRQEDVLAVKRDSPEIGLYPGDFIGAGSSFDFGWQPAGKSPFLDERVRQAISHSLDRDLFIEVVGNVSKFESEGLPVETRWNTHVAATKEGWWLDPQGKDFGPNSKYFKYDLVEAKRLLSAAGYPNGIDVVANVPQGPAYGVDYQRLLEISHGMARDAGFRITQNLMDYQSVYIPQVRAAKGQYEGFSTGGGATVAADIVAILVSNYHSKGGDQFLGFDAASKGNGAGDPQVDALLDRAKRETDTDRRKALIHDLQRHLAKPMYTVNSSGVASGFTMAWPALKNFRVFRPAENRGPPVNNYYWWIDESQPPISKA